jgi:hypothetical protein
MNVSVACMGPPVTIIMAGGRTWSFDSTQDTQTFPSSIVVQDVTFTINGDSLVSAMVNNSAATLGAKTTPIALPLGSITISISLIATGEMSRTYQLIFERGASLLEQVRYEKPSNTGIADAFATSLSLSGDTLAVGAAGESSSTTGVNGKQDDDGAAFAGAVYIFARTGTTWTQQAYIKASNTGAGDRFGYSVALSGETLAVGAIGESSAAVGVNGNQSDNTTGNAGAVYIFVRSGTAWTQQAYIKASNTGLADLFGYSVALSGDTLGVGAIGEASAANGIGGAQSDNSSSNAGAVYIFARIGITWIQQAYVKASNTGTADNFGCSIVLSNDTLAVGAYGEDSAATAINGNPADNSAPDAGAVYVFVRVGITWSQQAYIKASNAGAGDSFGYSVALSANTLAVGAYSEDSAATEVNGDQADNGALDSGAVYIFVYMGTSWVQQAYVKASNAQKADFFGGAVALYGDTLAVGAFGEDSAATGVNGIQSDNSASGAGAIYVFVGTGGIWKQLAYAKASNTEKGDFFGTAIALSENVLVVGAPEEDSVATGADGNQIDNGALGAGATYILQ